MKTETDNVREFMRPERAAALDAATRDFNSIVQPAIAPETKVGQKIDHKAFAETHCRFDDMTGLVNAVRNNSIVWSWGAHAWTRMNDYCLRFMVQGHHHNGHVYIVVNGSDLFDVYLTSRTGTIKDVITDLFLEDLIGAIDERVERIPAYKH